MSLERVYLAMAFPDSIGWERTIGTAYYVVHRLLRRTRSCCVIPPRESPQIIYKYLEQVRRQARGHRYTARYIPWKDEKILFARFTRVPNIEWDCDFHFPVSFHIIPEFGTWGRENGISHFVDTWAWGGISHTPFLSEMTDLPVPIMSAFGLFTAWIVARKDHNLLMISASDENKGREAFVMVFDLSADVLPAIVFPSPPLKYQRYVAEDGSYISTFVSLTPSGIGRIDDAQNIADTLWRVHQNEQYSEQWELAVKDQKWVSADGLFVTLSRD